MRSIVFGSILVVFLSGAAQAQLRQPRCGGWPPTPGREGMIIGGAGSTCYGQIFMRTRPSVSLVAVRVKSPPAQGSFRMIGMREFEYTPRPGLRGMDRIVLDTEWSRGGRTISRDQILRATTDTEYEAAGGSANRPPEGSNVDRRTHGRGRRM